MFWQKIKSSEYKELSTRLQALESRVNLQHIDMVLLEERLGKAIQRKVIKRETEEEQPKDLLGSVLLPSNEPIGKNR